MTFVVGSADRATGEVNMVSTSYFPPEGSAIGAWPMFNTTVDLQVGGVT